MEPKITFRLPKDLYDKAKDKARSEDVTLSQALRGFLRNWVEDVEPPVHPHAEVQQTGDHSGRAQP
jgi:hypothetical protein